MDFNGTFKTSLRPNSMHLQERKSLFVLHKRKKLRTKDMRVNK